MKRPFNGSFIWVIACASMLIGCAKPDTQIAQGCRSQEGKVLLQCWAPLDGPVRDCVVAEDELQPCGLGEAAIRYAQSSTRDQTMVDGRPQATWVLFEVRRDADGRIGRPVFDSDGNATVGN